MRFHCAVRFVLCVVFLLIPLTALAGTSPFLLDRQPTGQLEFGYRFQHPHFAGEVEADLLMGYHELSVGIPINPDFVFSLTAPLVNWGFETSFEPDDSTKMGNITLGAHVLNVGARQNMSLMVALQLPTANEVASLGYLGLVSHPSAWQTFLEDAVTVQTHFAVRIPATAESFLRLELGPDILIPTGDNNASTVFLMRYGLGLGVETGRIGASIEFGGFWDVDGDRDGYSENSYHVLAAGMEYVGAVVRPALYYQIPTDEMFDSVIDGVFGIRITVTP